MKHFFLTINLLIILNSFGQEIKHNSFTDNRDNKKYNTIKISGIEIMLSNLDYNSTGSFYYKNSTEYKEYGRFYTMPKATDVCPKGWKLSSKKDWQKIIEHLRKYNFSDKKITETLNIKLSGLYYGEDDFFDNINSIGYYWTSTKDSYGYSEGIFYSSWGENNDKININYVNYDNSDGLCVRCVKSSEQNVDIKKYSGIWYPKTTFEDYSNLVIDFNKNSSIELYVSVEGTEFQPGKISNIKIDNNTVKFTERRNGYRNYIINFIDEKTLELSFKSEKIIFIK